MTTPRLIGIPLLRVQHHYAHILACMAENGVTEPVIGVSFDGTGYGDDGTVWGGELLLCDTQKYRRIGHIEPFAQSGGDASAREGWRIAAALLDNPAECAARGICTEQEARVTANLARLGVNTVQSTSCGRIFDAASAILGLRRVSTFEGEASMALMAAAERYVRRNGTTRHTLLTDIAAADGRIILQTTALIREIALLYAKSPDRETAEALAYGFHAALCDMIVRACTAIRKESGVGICALSGGVFQNRLLTAMTSEKLAKAGFRVLLHSLIPPNDGGICIGQAVYGICRTEAEKGGRI